MVGTELSVWLCASHTHSGPAGGYDRRCFYRSSSEAPALETPAPQYPGPRLPRPARSPRRPGVRARPGCDGRAPRIRSSRWVEAPRRNSRSTSYSGPCSLRKTLTTATIIATLMAFGAHPTVVSGRAALASADGPGAAAEVLARHRCPASCSKPSGATAPPLLRHVAGRREVGALPKAELLRRRGS